MDINREWGKCQTFYVTKKLKKEKTKEATQPLKSAPFVTVVKSVAVPTYHTVLYQTIHF